MSNWLEDLDRFLQTDSRDAGCEKAMELLHVYAEVAIADPRAAEQRYPGVAAHLRACFPCEQDLDGLIAAIKADADIAESLPRRRTSRRAVSPPRRHAAKPLSASQSQARRTRTHEKLCSPRRRGRSRRRRYDPPGRD